MVVLGKGHCDAQTLVPKALSASRTDANMKSQLKQLKKQRSRTGRNLCCCGGCCCCFLTRRSTMRLYQRHRSSNWTPRCRVTWESDSRRLRDPLEPSSTHSCERSKARKTGAQLRDNQGSAKDDAKCVKTPFTAIINSSAASRVPLLCCTTGMSTVTCEN